jgi:hypothetical protein
MKKIIILAMLAAMLSVIPAKLFAQSNTFNVMGNPIQHTVAISTTDSSVLLTSALDTAFGATVDYRVIRAVLITCETNDARIAFGVAAAKGASPVGHVLAAGSSLRLPSYQMLQAARIISKTAGSAALLQISLEY